jgi:hypothetical protein
MREPSSQLPAFELSRLSPVTVSRADNQQNYIRKSSVHLPDSSTEQTLSCHMRADQSPPGLEPNRPSPVTCASQTDPLAADPVARVSRSIEGPIRADLLNIPCVRRAYLSQ